MTQTPLDSVVRQRIRGLRQARGWTLETLAARAFVSISTLSRIETGQRRIALEQLVTLAQALGTTLDQLVEPENDEDVLIRPEAEIMDGATLWLLSREQDRRGVMIAKMRITPERKLEGLQVHPGYEWFTVLLGVVHLHLGDRIIVVHEGQAAEFSTMTPHAVRAVGSPAEILTILDRGGNQAHLPGRTHLHQDMATGE